MNLSIELSDGRTSPAVVFDIVPTPIKITHNAQNSPFISEPECVREVSNFKLNHRSRRSFTPIKTNIGTPELSPIASMSIASKSPDNKEDSFRYFETDKSEFSTPILLNSKNNSENTKSYNLKQTSKTSFPDPNVLLALDKSAAHGYLNHRLDVRFLLRNAGLMQYIKLFRKIKFDEFLLLKEGDLQKMGIKCKSDRLAILKVIDDQSPN